MAKTIVHHGVTQPQVDPALQKLSLARACASKVALGLALTVGVVGGLGKLIEQWAVLVGAMAFIARVLASVKALFLAAIYGHFWPFVLAGGAALLVSAWASCVTVSLPNGRAKNLLFRVAASAGVLWFVCTLVMMNTYDATAELSVYQKLTALVMCFPPVGALFIGSARALGRDGDLAVAGFFFSFVVLFLFCGIFVQDIMF